jgi:type III secretion protein D
MDIKLPPEIVIIAGEQIGARAPLDSNQTITLSGASDTDVMLRDANIESERLKISTLNNKAYIEVINGNIEIEGKSVKHGRKMRLHEYTKVKIGDTAFIYTNEPHISLEEILNKVSAEISKTKSLYFKQSTKPNRFIILFSLLILLILTVVLINIVKASFNDAGEHALSTKDTIQGLLYKNGFESLNLVQRSTGLFAVNGFVMTNKERALLENIIDEYKVPVILDLEIGDQLAMEVRELFRVNGIEILAETVQEGVVKVIAKSNSVEEFERIRNIALKEIANLKSMKIELTEKDARTQTIGSNMNYNEADKRITMVVGGDPAYIMTADQSKYYVGALLPTGHKIVDIIDQQVILEKQGKQKTLEF